MKRPGSIYRNSDGKDFLAIYNYNHDVSVMLPSALRQAERVAAVSYSRGRRKGGVDIFLLPENNREVSDLVTVKKTFSFEENAIRIINSEGKISQVGSYDSDLVDFSYDIRAKLASTIPEVLRLDALDFARADIYDFCKENIAEDVRGSSIETVQRIIPTTEIKKLKQSKMLTGGKAEFIPQCVLEANIDYTDGCLASWIPGENASFSENSSIDYWHYPWGDCDYCYAMQKHRAFPKTIHEFDQKMLLEELKGGARLVYGSDEPWGRPIEILRFGKRTEPWTPFTENDFLLTLETMLETRTKGVITTKFLPFKEEFVSLLKRTRSTLLYSTGGTEDIELGPLEWSCGNDFRLEQAVKYREAGVNSALFYLMNPLFAPSEKDIERLTFAEEHKIPVQFIPARFYNKDVAEKIVSPLAGMSGANVPLWDILKDDMPGQTSLLEEDYWFAKSYDIASGILMPKLDRMHPFWAEKIKKNTGKIRMCAHDNTTTFCGGCFTKPGTISPTEHPEHNPGFVKLTRNKNLGRRNTRMPKEVEVDPNQADLRI